MRSQPIKELVDKVTKIMEVNNCRLYDSDIIRALNRTTFDYNSFKGFHNIKVDLSDLCRN